MKFRKYIFLIVWVTSIVFFPLFSGEECTTAVIRPEASVSGRALLWKNRDTDVLSNKVIYVAEQPHSYIALVNNLETSGRMVYAGLNSRGLAIMNSVAYNLSQKEDEMKDLEGQIMADALRTCGTVDDFQQYIIKNLGASLGSLANFGVIDRLGNAVIFEVHNHGYQRIDAAGAAERYLINTNYSRSGEKDKGYGFLRFDRASRLFKESPDSGISPGFILRNVARDLGHSLLRHPTLEELESIPGSPPLWIYSRDCINRPSTSAVVVVEGKKPGPEQSLATFWVILGEPVTSIAVPLWVEAGEVPEVLWQGTDAPICSQAFRIKKMIRQTGRPEWENYMMVNRLINRERTGFLRLILKTEGEILKETEVFLKQKRLPLELAIFQNKMARKALTTLKGIQ
jgi:hypothetical protein